MRALGWRGPILLLEGCFEPRDLEPCSRLDLWHVVHCAAQIDWLAAHKTHAPHRVFLKLNSGMNRLGFAPAAFRAAWPRLDALPQVDEISLMTHFSDADGDARHRAPALAAFEAATRDLPGERSLWPTAPRRCAHAPRRRGGDWVRRRHHAATAARPTIPQHDIAHWDLRPAMTLRSRLIATQQLARRRQRRLRQQLHRRRADAHRHRRLRLCRRLPAPHRRNERHAGAGRRRAHAHVGRVSMDMLTVDLAPCPTRGVGSEVTLWGRGRSGTRAADRRGGARRRHVGYELMCALAPRVPVRIADDAP